MFIFGAQSLLTKTSTSPILVGIYDTTLESLCLLIVNMSVQHEKEKCAQKL